VVTTGSCSDDLHAGEITTVSFDQPVYSAAVLDVDVYNNNA
jgi:hypothetical protein